MWNDFRKLKLFVSFKRPGSERKWIIRINILVVSCPSLSIPLHIDLSSFVSTIIHCFGAQSIHKFTVNTHFRGHKVLSHLTQENWDWALVLLGHFQAPNEPSQGPSQLPGWRSTVRSCQTGPSPSQRECWSPCLNITAKSSLSTHPCDLEYL